MHYFLLFLLLLPVSLLSQDDTKPWERLGLSLTEWKLIQDNRMPMEKVEELLKAGIGISEYFQNPWKKLGMTEPKWIAKRRMGLTNDDIERQALGAKKDTSMQPAKPEAPTFRELDRSRENRELFAAFFLPGYMQLREQRKGRGAVMVSLAAVSIAGCAAWSAANRQFMSLPLFMVLIPDMGWSFVDHKVNRSSNAQ